MTIGEAMAILKDPDAHHRGYVEDALLLITLDIVRRLDAIENASKSVDKSSGAARRTMRARSASLPTDTLWTSEQTATFLQLSREHLSRLRQGGNGPRYTKLGDAKQSHVRYKPEDVYEWIGTG